MKDKLHKTGHTKPYYRFVSALRGFGFSLLALVVLATPVAIAAGVNAYEAAAEQTSHVETTSEEPVSSSAE